MSGVFITGTNTDVGKTYVGTLLIKALRNRDIRVKPRKPVESGWPIDDAIQRTDSWKLAEAADCLDEIDTVCPNCFPDPLSPVRAARIVGKTLSLEILKDQCFDKTLPDDFLYIEGAGGFYSPLVEDGLNADLASSLSLPVVLIANNKLGCISQILLCHEAIQRRQLDLRAIILNQVTPDASHQAMNNQQDVAEYVSQPVFSLSYGQEILPAPLIDLLY